jgi:hypothetical protein
LQFTPPALGAHTATLTFTPDAASGLPAQSWTLRGEGLFNLAYGTHRAGGNHLLWDNPAAPAGSTVGFGQMVFGVVPGAMSGSAVRFVAVDITGTHGQVGGTWALTGGTAAGFRILGSRPTDGSFFAHSACPAPTADGQSAPRCLSGNAEGHTVQLQFTPPALGAHTATLTFTPDAASGLPAQSWTLQGEGVFNLAYGTHRAGVSAAPSSNPAAPAGSTVDFGSLASSSTLRYVMLDVNGTHGQMAGTWFITGDAEFTIGALRATEGTFTSVGSCATVQAGGRATDRCLSPAVTGQQVELRFTAGAAGTRAATLTFTPDAATGMAPVSWLLAGSSPMPSVSPVSLAFGAVEVSAATTRTVTLAAGGAVRLGGISVTVGAAEFSVSHSCPSTLTNGASCPLTVSHTAAQAGARAGTLRVEFLDGVPPIEVPLTSSATATVLLGDASSSPAASCRAVLHARPTAATGTYWVDPDGAGAAFAPTAVHCDMVTDGGGWTLVARIRGDSFAHTSTDAVETVTSPTQATAAKLSDAFVTTPGPEGPGFRGA